ncbi:MAG: STAS domain-containing protein [Rhodocyclaceae bacterium]
MSAPSQPSASAEALLLKLEGEITIYRAEEIRQALIAALETQRSIALDLSAVTELDTTGVQLLLAARRTAQTRGQALHLTNHSAAVVEVFETLDIAAQFDDPILLSAHAA